MSAQRVFIIGAGLAGLACADVLSRAGIDVRVADKGRGPGGRLSSRRSPVGRFDHGAPFFSAQDLAFREQVSAWEAEGIVAPWRAGDEDVWVATPAMNSVIRHDAERLGAEFGLEIAAPKRRGAVWDLYTVGGQAVAEADIVVCAAPAPQTADRLPEGALKDTANAVIYAPQWTLMVGLDPAPASAFPDYQSWGDGPFEKAIAQAARPGREDGSRLVFYASQAWSTEHLEMDKDEAALSLLRLAEEAGYDLPDPAYLAAQRWRYSRVIKPVGNPFGLDLDNGLATCGDWHLGPDCEHAWLSGHSLGRRLAEVIC
ncbi:MAG: NAD(P)-binding protein [Pseudomonadota bacterium]